MSDSDRVRIEMAHELHTALYGDSWARPHTPQQVWEALLVEVRKMAAANPPPDLPLRWPPL